MYSVAVLMSTYNGSCYLREQLDSILRQKNVEVKLFIRDDGSSDDTERILDEYARKYSNISYYVGENKRSCKSFLELLYKDYSTDYFAFADQDDVWDDDKLFSGISQIESIERTEKTPVMYYSNLRIVDENLNFHRLSHKRPLIYKYDFQPLIENLATGCTIIFNKEAHALARKYKIPSFTMHDSLMFVLCAVFGKIVYDFTPHIQYRQHSGNVIGAALDRNFIGFIHECKERFLRLFNRDLQPSFNNVCALWNCCGPDLPDDYKKICKWIVNYKKSMFFKCKVFFCKQYRPGSWLKNITARILILLEIV